MSDPITTYNGRVILFNNGVVDVKQGGVSLVDSEKVAHIPDGNVKIDELTIIKNADNELEVPFDNQTIYRDTDGFIKARGGSGKEYTGGNDIEVTSEGVINYTGAVEIDGDTILNNSEGKLTVNDKRVATFIYPEIEVEDYTIDTSSATMTDVDEYTRQFEKSTNVQDAWGNSLAALANYLVKEKNINGMISVVLNGITFKPNYSINDEVTAGASIYWYDELNSLNYYVSIAYNEDRDELFEYASISIEVSGEDEKPSSIPSFKVIFGKGEPALQTPQTVVFDETEVSGYPVIYEQKYDEDWNVIGGEYKPISASYVNSSQMYNAINSAVAGKQNKLTAGRNIQISGNTISATDTTYTAGNHIQISNNKISAEWPVIPEPVEYTAGQNITISEGVISAEDLLGEDMLVSTPLGGYTEYEKITANTSLKGILVKLLGLETPPTGTYWKKEGTTLYLRGNTQEGYQGYNGGEPWGKDITNVITETRILLPSSCYRMFYECSSLTSLDVSNWDTSNVTNMVEMLRGCENLTSLDVSNWDTSNVTNMQWMFVACNKLTSLDLSNWNTSNVTNMTAIFSCQALTSLDVSNWDTSNVTNIDGIFSWCTSLTSLDLSNWDTSNVTNMDAIFFKCSNLTTIYVSNKWSNASVVSGASGQTFEGCTSLVGGAGTACDGYTNTDATYARIDNPPTEPGYFTLKQ